MSENKELNGKVSEIENIIKKLTKKLYIDVISLVLHKYYHNIQSNDISCLEPKK